MRYILALIPPNDHKLAYMRAAEAFAPINDGYLLCEDKSFPHVTLCSFQCEENLISELWTRVQAWQMSRCPLRMIGLMLKKGKVPPHHYSVSLSATRDTQLLTLHHHGLELIESYGLASLNPCRELYNPHLTLAGICWLPANDVTLPSSIANLLLLPSKDFHLALGRGDDIGQYLETIYTLNDVSSLREK